MILSDYTIVDENGHLQHIHRYDNYTNPFSIGQLTWQDREDWFIHGLTYRTALLHEMDYRQTEGISYTDEEWITKPLALVNACYRFNGTLYRYTVGREGQSMSPAVYAKSLGMRLAVAKSVLSFYSSLDKGTPVSAFVKGRLTSLLNHIYHTTLFSKKTNKEALEALRSFDGQLASDEAEIHAALDRTVTIAGLHFRPVRVFREEKSCRLSVIRGLYATTNALNNLRQTQ